LLKLGFCFEIYKVKRIKANYLFIKCCSTVYLPFVSEIRVELNHGLNHFTDLHIFSGIGGESLAVAQNTFAVAWFKGKELNMVFGFQVSLSLQC
jgi:hypothetical protein